MSASLVKKSLEILESEQFLEGSKKKKPGVAAKYQSSNRNGVKKYLKRLKNQQANSAKTPKEKFRDLKTIDQLRAQRKLQDKTEENLKRLRVFTEYGVDEELENKILVKLRKEVEPKPEEESETVFTEEDFEKFEQDYFVS